MDRLAPHGGCNWSGCKECFPNYEGQQLKAKVEEQIRVIRQDLSWMIGADQKEQIETLQNSILKLAGLITEIQNNPKRMI